MALAATRTVWDRFKEIDRFFQGRDPVPDAMPRLAAKLGTFFELGLEGV